MAGGPNAAAATCLTCALSGTVQRSERIREGIENDWFRCALGHEFGVDFRRGPPVEPLWPPSKEEVKAIQAMAKSNRA